MTIEMAVGIAALVAMTGSLIWPLAEEGRPHDQQSRAYRALVDVWAAIVRVVRAGFARIGLRV